LAAEHEFDALVTKDSGVRYEQNVAKLPCAVVILQAKSNSLRDIEPLMPMLLSELKGLKPMSIVRIG
jgi:hypothetical protein